MQEVKRILFPVDLTAVSPRIAPVALEMSNKFNAELHLLHVAVSMDQLRTVYDAVHPSLGDLERDLEEASEKKLKEFEEKYCQGCSSTTRIVLRGDPAEQILSYIESAGIDFVVMGTHGRKGLERAFFGSVADKVVRGSTAPVLTVNPYRGSGKPIP